jgi:hypothetical protein
LGVSLCERHNVWGSGDTTFLNPSTNTVSVFAIPSFDLKAMLGGAKAYQQLGNQTVLPI